MIFDNETGRILLYWDINSLYPAMAVFMRFPVGLPTRYIGKSVETVGYDPQRGFYSKETGKELVGQIQCRVLPPESIFLPALPTTVNGKSKYGLCQTCMTAEHKGWCTHSDEERAITDVWTTAELHYAISECGYRILETFECILYDETKAIFVEFYTLLATMKLESEGFPKDVVTPEQKAAYCAELNEAMPGLDLKPENVKHNHPRRQFAKEVSNTTLGKLSQNEQRTNVAYAYCWEDISRIKYSADKKLTSVYPISENVAEVKYVPNEERAGFAKGTQCVVYSFITSFARVKLLRDLRHLQKKGARIFYCDTGKYDWPMRQLTRINVSYFLFADSVIFDFPEDGDLEGLKKEFKLGSPAYGAWKSETQYGFFIPTYNHAKN